MRGRRSGKTGGVFAGIHRVFFSDRERRRWSQIVRRSRTVNVDRLLVCLRSREGKPCDIALGLGLLEFPGSTGIFDAAE